MSDADEVEEPRSIDLIADELGLARAQLDAGQPALAEGTVRRRMAHLEADGADANEETDALRVLLAESLWRQGRPLAARTALECDTPRQLAAASADRDAHRGRDARGVR